jgi:hypothetical protein
MRPAHASRVVAVSKASFDQLSALTQETFPFGALQSLPVCVDDLLLRFLACPMPLARLLFLRNVGADAGGLHLF